MRPDLLKVVPVLAFLSGAAALTYESLWMRAFGLVFGVTTHAVSVTLLTFMGGLALGSYLVSRVRLRRALLVYAVVEGGIGLSALLTWPLLRGLPGWYASVLRGRDMAPAMETLLRFAGAAAVVLVPTLLLGATFPLLVEVLTRGRREFHASLGLLYKVNTLGGAAGVFLGGFVLLPLCGVRGTYVCAALANLTVGLVAFLLDRRSRVEPTPAGADRPPQAARAGREATIGDRGSARGESLRGALPPVFVLTAAATGACSFGLEILWTRSLALVIGSSIYSFNLMLIAFLLGIVLGTALYERARARLANPAPWLAATLGGVGLLIVIDLAIVGWLPLVFFNVMRIVPATFVVHQAAGFLLCMAVMLPITTAFGFTFPLLAHLVVTTQRTPREVSGILYAWNTLGAIAGTLVTSFLLIPVAGLEASYVWTAALPLLSGLMVLAGARSGAGLARIGAGAIAAVAIVLLGVMWRPWDLLLMTSGVYKYGAGWVSTARPGFFWLRDALRETRELQFYEEGREAVVSVFRTGSDHAIVINGKADGGTSLADSSTQRLVAHVPLLVHPDPRRVLVIGWGTGATAGSAAVHAVRDLHVVEIEPAVFRAAPFFTKVNLDVERDPRFRMVFDDARKVLLTSAETYDVIISEPSNPWITGVANLFTEDFYRLALPRLEDGGILCQWFHVYQMNLDDIRTELRTFAAVFPHASLWLAPASPPEEGPVRMSGDLILLGSRTPILLDVERVRERFANDAIVANLAAAGVRDATDLLLDQVMDREDLRAFAGDGRRNTDDHPVIEFSAPRGLFLGPEENARIYGLLESGGRAIVPPLVHEPGLDAGAGPQERAATYVRLAAALRRKSMLTRAERLLREAIRLDGDLAEAHASLGEVLYAQGKREEGERILVRSLEMDPGLKQPYAVLGFLSHERGDLARARRMFDELNRRFPDEAMGYYGQALVDAEERDWPRSRERLKRALALQPDFGLARQLLTFVEGKMP